MTTTDHAKGTLDFSELVGELRGAFNGRVTRPTSWRHEQLRQMERMLVENEAEFVAALEADLGKPPIEGWMTDLAFTRQEIKLLDSKLDKWTADEKVRMPLDGAAGVGPHRPRAARRRARHRAVELSDPVVAGPDGRRDRRRVRGRR